jgi:hypothetical protein
VAVAFGLQGFHQLFVLGGLWNGKDGLPPAVAKVGPSDRPLVRTWRSPKGHSISLLDTSDNKIEILSKDGRMVSLDHSGKTITIKTSQVSITLKDDQLEINAGTTISVKAGANLKLEANGNLDIQASGQVTIKGATIQLN